VYVSMLRHPLTYTLSLDRRRSPNLHLHLCSFQSHRSPYPGRVATCHTRSTLSYPHPYTSTQISGTSYLCINSLLNSPANCKENGDPGRPGSGLRVVQDDAGGRTGHPGGEHQSGAAFCSSITDEETNVRLHLHACALERSLSRSTRRASPWIQKKMEERN
jgi:hypothetical protein